MLDFDLRQNPARFKLAKPTEVSNPEEASMEHCVIGKTEYVHAGYKPHMFENSHIQTDNWGEAYQTCNIAYLTSAVKEIGGFDAKNFNHMNEDIDLAIRIKEKFPDKKFIRNREMKVIHQKIEWTIYSVICFSKFFKSIMTIIN